MNNRFVTGMLAGFLFMGQALFHFALDPKKKISQYIHHAWGFEQGLPHSSINTILQTRDGYLWLGTEEGLARFDGVRFEVFDKRRVAQMSIDSIWAFYQDREGNIWSGTSGGGLTRMDSTDGTFTTYSKKHGLAHNTVCSILEDYEGSLWIGTEGGLNRLRNGTFTTYTKKQGLSDNYIQYLCEDRKGNLWIGTGWGGLNGMNLRKKDGKITKYTTKEGLSHNTVNAVHEDSGGGLWIGTDGGLNRLENGKITVYTTKDGLSSNYIHPIYEDRGGSLWIGTYDAGLNRMERRENGGTPLFTHFTTKDGLSDDQVWSIHEDREGNLWVGTQVGLNQLVDGKFINYTTREGLSKNKVWCVCEGREGSMWFGCENGGLNRLKNGTFTTYTTKDGLSSNTIWSLLEDREGNLWLGSKSGGLNRFDFHPETGTFTFNPNVPKQGLSDNSISAFYEDREGSLWLATYGWGLKRYKDGNITTFNQKQGLSGNYLCSLHQDREGNLWIGTYGSGLNRMDYKSEKITAYTTDQGLANDYVYCIYEDEAGSLWIGTHGGLNRLKNGKFTSVTVKEGLFNDIVYTILDDDRGNFWMSCNKGIYRVGKKELNRCCDGKISTVHYMHYDDKDGMKSRECYGTTQPAGWKTRDGKLWYPTYEGVAVIEPGNTKTNPLPPPVTIETIIADNIAIHAPFSSASNNGKPVFPPGIERIEIHYTGLSFSVPDRVRFKCKLEGFDKQWRDMDTRRTAYYTKLSPRAYTFRVTACNNDGLWNDAGTSVSFYLKPYFYQTPWFYLAAAAGVLFLGFGIYRLRVRQLTHRKMELERLVDERTRQLEKSYNQLETFTRELEKLSIVASETDNSVAILDAEGNLEWMNEATTRMYGYTLEQIFKEKGRNITRISAHPDIRDMLDKFLAEPKPLRYETLYRTRNGKEIWVQ
ncbi:MAG: PAS domain-containing protein, partial [bacterium]|nr:PAS domain-containing protein [bacterium]